MLEQSYRLPAALMEMTNKFATTFLPDTAEKVFAEAQNEFLIFEPAVLRWKQIKKEEAVDTLFKLICEKTLQKEIERLGLEPLTMADIVFLVPNGDIGRKVVRKLDKADIRVHHTFADEYRAQRSKVVFLQGQRKGERFYLPFV